MSNRLRGLGSVNIIPSISGVPSPLVDTSKGMVSLSQQFFENINDYWPNIGDSLGLVVITETPTPFLRTYAKNGGVLTRTITDPPATPYVGNDLSISNDGTYMVVTLPATPYIKIYKRSGDTFTVLSNPATLPAGASHGCAFDPTGTYLAIAHSGTPYVAIYKRSGDTFTKLSDPATLPTGIGWNASWSNDSTYLVITHTGSPFITIYKRSDDTFTKLANPASTPVGLPSGLKCVAFDPTDTYMAVAHTNSPYIIVYKRSGDTFTKITPNLTAPSTNGRSVDWSPDGLHLALGCSNGPPGYYIYKLDSGTDTFTRLSTPTGTLTSGAVSKLKYSGDYLVATEESSTGAFDYLHILLRTGDSYERISGSPVDQIQTGALGFDFIPV